MRERGCLLSSKEERIEVRRDFPVCGLRSPVCIKGFYPVQKILTFNFGT